MYVPQWIPHNSKSLVVLQYANRQYTIQTHMNIRWGWPRSVKDLGDRTANGSGSELVHTEGGMHAALVRERRRRLQLSRLSMVSREPPSRESWHAVRSLGCHVHRTEKCTQESAVCGMVMHEAGASNTGLREVIKFALRHVVV